MESLSSLVETSARVAASASRNAKVRELSALLKSLPPDLVETGVLFLSGNLRQGRIGIGQGALRAAALEPPAPVGTLRLHDVDATLQSIAATSGAGSAARRASLLSGLFREATAAEQDFLRRLLGGDLRQGALDGVMVDAIATASQLPAASVRRAAMYSRSLGEVAAAALAHGEPGLQAFHLRLLQPVAPMLAQVAVDVAEALRELPAPVQFEWKMDGARIQVHKRGDEVHVYTRAMNEIGASLPEVVEATRAMPATEMVLDGEALGHAADGRPHPFQVTMRRFGRRLDVQSLLADVPMQAFFFDCLLLEGESLVDLPLQQRVAAMDRVVPRPARMPRLVTADVAEAAAFQAAALAAGHEGVMAKSLASAYEAGSRGASWFKIKRAHTLDLVVLAAEWGNGRRRGLLSNLHLGAMDPPTGEYVMLGKTFKGLTDEMLAWQTRELLAREVRRDANTVYVRPELVVEIAFSDLQASPRYPGGLALRLARVKRYREDKRASEADTMESVRRIV
jgi:DNA ligase-1